MKKWLILCLGAILTLAVFEGSSSGADAETANYRKPKNETDLRYWLENMVWYHHFSHQEIQAATGLAESEIAAALDRWKINPSTRPDRSPQASLLILPYPGGRHPRIGFLEGAIRPQRETKVSVFTPWNPDSYVVLDVPEALWSNLGLTYLAHTHIPTVWNKKNIRLDRLEWNRRPDGTLDFERRLPNGIVFGSRIKPERASVRMEMWMTNGSGQPLSDLRVQNCLMLKAALGFNQLTNANKVLSKPYVACRNPEGNRWIIVAWEPCHHPWANADVPCLHSDPKFPDLAPGQTGRLRGWLSFYEGTDVQAEFQRIDRTGWRKTEGD
jgi:hypothetical protein